VPSQRGDIAPATEFRSLTGRGVEATVEGTTYAVGGPALLRERDIKIPAELEDTLAAWRQRGAAVLHLVRADGVIGAFELEDEIRPEARQAVADLQAEGIKVVMITGDARQVADTVAAELGIDEVFADPLRRHRGHPHEPVHHRRRPQRPDPPPRRPHPEPAAA
jgi:P-type Cu2+ transporter